LPLLSFVGQGTASPLPDQLPLHLREAPEEGEDEAPVRRGRVEGFTDRVQLDPLRQEEVLYEGEEVTGAAGEAVQLPDDDVTDLSSSALLKEIFEARPPEILSGKSFIG
jgi:hypothetical protein